MEQSVQNVKKVFKDQRGQSLVEYGLLIIMAVVGIVAAFGHISGAMEGAGSTVGGFITDKASEVQTTP